MSDRISSGWAALHDGRRLAYLAVGPADGLLVLYLHGALGSPQAVDGELERLTHALGIRYVMVSRPGFGSSDAAPGRTLRGFARDAAGLADHLGHEHFAVVGVSAGGPYALACAHELPARVMATAIVAGMAPGATAGLPPAARLAVRVMRTRPGLSTRVADALLAVARRLPQRASAGGVRPERATARMLAAAPGGVAGMIDDCRVWSQPWGFRPADIAGVVALWHGMQDPLVPVDDAIHLAAELPRAQAALHPDEGHFFYRRRLREILGDLVRLAAETPVSSSSEQLQRGRVG